MIEIGYKMSDVSSTLSIGPSEWLIKNIFPEHHEPKYPMLAGFKDLELFPFLKKIQVGDWNSQFQNSVELLKTVTLDLNSPLLEKVAAAFSLINLARDFVFTANQVGRFIVT